MEKRTDDQRRNGEAKEEFTIHDSPHPVELLASCFARVLKSNAIMFMGLPRWVSGGVGKGKRN